MNSSILYNGYVTIHNNNRKPTILKNNGTSALFNLICNLLAQKITNTSTEMPLFIDIVTSSGSSYDPKKSLLYSPMLIIDKTVNTKLSSVELSSLLTYSNIKDHNVTSVTFMLLDGSKSSVLAYAEGTIRIEETTQVVVDWTLTFNNNSQGGNQ